MQDIMLMMADDLESMIEASTGRLVASYRRLYDKLTAEAQELADEVARMRAAGEMVSAAQIRRMERYTRLIGDTRNEMQKYGALVDDAVRTAQEQAVERSSAYAQKLLGGAFGDVPEPYRSQIIATFDRMPKEAMRALVGALQESSPLGRLLDTFGADSAQAIGDALLKGLASGIGPRTTARLIEQQFGMPLTRALTITRTETIRAHRAAQMENFRRNEHVVRGWTWHAQMDDRTCLSCIALHGTHHPLNETLDDHPNGRCAMVPDPVSFKELGIDLPDMAPVADEGDGEAWFRAQPEATQRAMMGNAKFEAWQEGKFEFSQLSKANESADWGRSFTEASLKDLIG